MRLCMTYQANTLPWSCKRTHGQSGQLVGTVTLHVWQSGASKSQWNAMEVRLFRAYCVGLAQYNHIQNDGILDFGIIKPEVMFLHDHRCICEPLSICIRVWHLTSTHTHTQEWRIQNFGNRTWFWFRHSVVQQWVSDLTWRMGIERECWWTWYWSQQ